MLGTVSPSLLGLLGVTRLKRDVLATEKGGEVGSHCFVLSLSLFSLQ